MTRKYTTISIETTLSAGISSTATSITVTNAANLMGNVTLAGGNVDQFACAIDPDTGNEEIVFVTAADTGTNILTVIRGNNTGTGTNNISHNAGATIKHVLTGEDLTYFETETLKQVNKTDIAAKGDLFAGTANDTYGILTVGTNERRLVADSAQTTGLKYVADTTNYAIAAKGDLLAGTAADTLQAVTVGSNGATLVADSTATPGVAWTGAQISKNYIINGDMAVTERGGNVSPTTSINFPLDRFFTRRSAGSDSLVICQRISSGGPESLPGFLRMIRVSSSTSVDTLYIGQTIESSTARHLQGKTVTFSFYARKGSGYTAASDALQVRVYTGTGTDQTGLGTGYTGTATPISSSATLTTSWQRFSFTATLSSTTNQIQATVQYTPVGTAPGGDYFDITGFQLEVGSVATPFSRAGGGDIGRELILCRRFYERWTTGALSRIGNGFAVDSTNTRITIYFKVTKRIAPFGTDNLNTEIVRSSTNTSFVLSSYSITSAGVDAITITGTATSASFTTGEFVELRGTNSGSYQGWDSEIE